MLPPGFVWRDGVRLAAAGCSRAAGVNFSLFPFLLILLGRLSLLFVSQYCCRYIFELHTLRDNHSTCRSFCCYLVVARLVLLVAHPFGSCCCPPGPRYRPIDLVIYIVWLLLSPLVWALLRLAFVIARLAFVVTPLAPLISPVWPLSRSPDGSRTRSLGRQFTIHSLSHLFVSRLRILRSRTLLLTVL